MGDFKYSDCPLKHYVRVKGWLPRCKSRKIAINKNLKLNSQRRLRYLTLCAVDAIDVLMLDVAKVLQPSARTGQFDSVAFFDRTEADVDETRKNISGAHGYFGNFVDVVLEAEQLTRDLGIDARLDMPTKADNTYEVRSKEQELIQYKTFKADFPFDVINLDLEEFIFKPTDEFPGKVIRALRILFDWQKVTNSTYADNGKGKARLISIDAFTLMFTTRLPRPESITDEYGKLLRDSVADNLARDPELVDRLKARGFEFDDLATFEARHFKEYYLIALRKVLSKCLLGEDWYVDESFGVDTFEFERVVDHGPYTMFHLIFEVKRQVPPVEKRATRDPAPSAVVAYHTVVRKIFDGGVTVVTDAIAKEAQLSPSLEMIDGRRRKYRREP